MYKIERLGHGGDGIVSGPIYAARTLPGEHVDGNLDGDRLIAPKIMTPSDVRVKPKCPAYNRCGGCSLHHADDVFVADWKAGIVLSALKARDVDAVVRNSHTSAPNTRRRAKMEGRRTKKGALVGFHGPRSNVLQNIDGCLTLDPAIIALIPALEAFTVQFGSRKGSLDYWILATETGIDLTIEGMPDRKDDLFVQLAEWAQLSSVARLTVGDEVVVTHTTPRLTFGSVGVTPPPKGFTQATVSAERFLQNAVSEALTGSKNIADLFSGCGTFGLALAHDAAVTCFEGDKGLIEALKFGVRHASNIKVVEAYVRDLFRNPILPMDLKYDGIVIDPPRAGADAQVQEIAQSDVRAVAMVSCNPITFARDVRALIDGGFTLNWLDVVDQFRWSTHIEVIAKLSR